MKKHILTSIFALVSASCFAIDSAAAVEPIKTVAMPTEQQMNLSQTMPSNTGFFYVRMNVAEPQAHTPEIKQTSFLPGLGLGYRRGQASAIDISFSFNHIQDGDEEATYWAFPKMSYLRYFSPKKTSSFYAGIGLTWGGVVLKDQSFVVQEITSDEDFDDEDEDFLSSSSNAFFGLIPTACVGYEANRKESSWRSFIQLEISQPVLAVAKKGEFPGPVAELSVGLGY